MRTTESFAPTEAALPSKSPQHFLNSWLEDKKSQTKILMRWSADQRERGAVGGRAERNAVVEREGEVAEAGGEEAEAEGEVPVRAGVSGEVLAVEEGAVGVAAESAAAAVGNGEGEGEGEAGEEDEGGGVERNAEEGDMAGGVDARGEGVEGPAVVEPSAGVKWLPYAMLYTHFSLVNFILVLLTLVICLN